MPQRARHDARLGDLLEVEDPGTHCRMLVLVDTTCGEESVDFREPGHDRHGRRRGQLGRPAACMAPSVPSDPENRGECDGTDQDDVDDDHQNQEVPTSDWQKRSKIVAHIAKDGTFAWACAYGVDAG